MVTAGDSPCRAAKRPSSRHSPRLRMVSSYVLATAAALVASISSSQGVAAAQFPSIDFDALGSVGVAGNFAGLQIWDVASSTLNTSNSFNPNASTIIERKPDGTLSQFNATGAGGSIGAICGRPDGSHAIFVGGNFTMMADISASNIASFDPSTNAWDSLAGGLDGPVNSVLCMDDIMVAGGNFTAPRTATPAARQDYHGAVAAWNYTSKAWQPLDFGGLNGTVNVIEPGVDKVSIKVGGTFDTQFGVLAVNGSQSGTNTSASSLTNKFAPVSLAMSLFEGGPASPSAQFNMAPQILCPQGADGPGNTYLFADDQAGQLRVSLFQKEWARAFRLGNTFHEGRGTQNFSITSLPDNTVLELLYLDPTTKKNVTCTTDCTLFHDPSIPYQDFLLTNATANNAPNGTKTMSGFVVDVKTWYGASAGLHILEMLSDGAWAKAWDAYNRGACNSPEVGVNGTGSGVTQSGAWYSDSLATEWGGVPDNVLQITDSYSNIASHSAATVSFLADTAVTGNYSAYLHVPGCRRSNQCGQRTDVVVTVLNNSTNPGTSTRVSQDVEDDTDLLVWDGPIQGTTRTFMPSFVLSIPTDAPRPSGGNAFTVVADRVRLQLRNSNQTYQMADSPHGFGVFEYNVIDAAPRATPINASATIPNTAINPFNSFGFTLASQGLSRNNSASISSIATLKNLTFVGGSFASSNFTVGANATGFKNIVAYDTRQNVTNSTSGLNITRLASGGVNGTVTALTPMGDFLYVGGAFTGLADASAEARYVARYDPVAHTWAALAGGPDGPVTDMAALSADGLLVSGNFTSLAQSRAVSGYAIWNTTTNSWMSEKELLVGQIQSVSVVNGSAYMVGSVEGLSANAASGVASVARPDKDGMPPRIQVLNFNFLPRSSAASSSPTGASPSTAASAASSGAVSAASSGSSAASSPGASSTNLGALISSAAAQATQRARDVPVEEVTRFAARSEAAQKHHAPVQRRAHSEGRSLLRGLTNVITGRGAAKPVERSALIRRADAMEPSSLQSSGSNDILASAFWQRSDGSYMTIIGGNFTTTAGIRNLAIYDPVKTLLYAFPQYASGSGNKPTIFRALTVVDNTLYAGGDGGLVTFDLAGNKWTSTGQSLSASSGSNLTVTAIGHRPDSTNVIVAGAFSQVGMLPCNNVCLWDTQSERWQPLGSGVDGQISALDFAGSKASNLVLAGSLTVNDQHAALATYDFNAQTWSPIGSIGSGGTLAPGPATAASVDDLNLNAIFAAGRTSDGTRPWLAKWDGTQFNTLQSSELKSDSGIAQLTFVPITKAHPSNNVLENNRLLVVSGALNMQTYGNVSSAFFDGHTWTPFLMSTASGGGPGVVRTFTRSTEVLKFPNLRHLAVGLVILISIAIGLGVVFLLVLLGLLVALARRRPQRGVDVPISPSDEALASEKKRPTSLLATLNAATENVMGAGAVGAGAAAATSSGHGRGGSVPLTSEGHDYSDPSSHYHSEAPTAGQSQYYTTDDSGDGHGRGAAAALGAGAIGAGAGAAAARGADSDDGSEQGVDAHMRFSFEATHPSELAVRAGDSVTILDDADEHWWLARAEDGRVGVVPASYVL